MSTSTTAAGPLPAKTLTTGAPARQLIILAAAAASVAITAAYAHAHPGAAADPALTRLLRAMAAIKMLLAAFAGAAVLWRLASPASPAWLAAYAAAIASTAAGPALIWNLSHIGIGALLLHCGLLATILLLWRDPVTAARLEQAIAARRLALIR
jgi:hypothetical protein